MEAEFKTKVTKWVKKNPQLAEEFIENHLPEILKNPYSAGNKLKNINVYSYHFHRKPEYRAIYGIEKGKVVFYLVASREEVYKDLKNIL